MNAYVIEINDDNGAHFSGLVEGYMRNHPELSETEAAERLINNLIGYVRDLQKPVVDDGYTCACGNHLGDAVNAAIGKCDDCRDAEETNNG